MKTSSFKDTSYPRSPLKSWLITSLFLVLGTAAQAGCWNEAERGEVDLFSEMENKMVVSIRDAVSCEPVTEAEIQLFGKNFTTDLRGEASFSADTIGEVTEKRGVIQIKKQGYVSYTQPVEVVLGSLKQKRFLVTKEIPIDSVRFVLQWGKKPNDLDLHLQSNRFHISYRNKRNIANFGKLDRDEKRGTGPETITLFKVKANETYRLTIHNYSGSPSLNDEVYVSVYANGKLDKVVHLSPSKKRYAEVLTIKNKKISYQTNYKNRIYPN